MKALILLFTTLFSINLPNNTNVNSNTVLQSEPLSTNIATDTSTQIPGSQIYTLYLTGGFQLEKNDDGKPISLMASVLGIDPEDLRNVLKKVNIKNFYKKTNREVYFATQKLLLEQLSKYGVTSQDLKLAMNQYRNKATDDMLWPQAKAEVSFTVLDGKVVDTKIIDPGIGYTATPTFKFVIAKKTFTGKGIVNYTKDVNTNGSINGVIIDN